MYRYVAVLVHRFDAAAFTRVRRSRHRSKPAYGRSLVAPLCRDDLLGRVVPTPLSRVLLRPLWRDAAAPLPYVILTTLAEGSPMYRYVAVLVHRFDAAAFTRVRRSRHRSKPAYGRSLVAPLCRDDLLGRVVLLSLPSGLPTGRSGRYASYMASVAASSVNTVPPSSPERSGYVAVGVTNSSAMATGPLLQGWHRRRWT